MTYNLFRALTRQEYLRTNSGVVMFLVRKAKLIIETVSGIGGRWSLKNEYRHKLRFCSNKTRVFYFRSVIFKNYPLDMVPADGPQLFPRQLAFCINWLTYSSHLFIKVQSSFGICKCCLMYSSSFFLHIKSNVSRVICSNMYSLFT